MSWSMLNPNGQRKYLTRDETNRFLEASLLYPADVYAFCWVIASTGCRISEALSIGAGNIDFESCHIVFETLKKRQRGVFRTVPLSEALLRRLTGWIADGTLPRHGRFWSWSRMTAYRRVIEVMRQAGVQGAWGTPKGLRHAFGVRAVHSGVPLNLVQRWLGHADMKTTSIYASAIGPEEREIASRTWLDNDKQKSRRSGFAIAAIQAKDPTASSRTKLSPPPTLLKSKSARNSTSRESTQAAAI